MAIVEMRRVSIVGPWEDREAALRAVGEAGVVDLGVELGPGRRVEEASAEPSTLRRRVVRVLEAVGDGSEERMAVDAAEGEALVERAEALLQRREELDARDRFLADERARLREWDDVDAEALERIASAGAHLHRFVVPRSASPELELGGLAWVHTRPLPRGRMEVLALALDAFPAIGHEPRTPPSRSVAAIEQERDELQAEREVVHAELESMRAASARLRGLLVRVDDHIALAHARDTLEHQGPLVLLHGHCPRDRIPALRRALEPLPLVLLSDLPSSEEQVPIALRNGPLTTLFSPLVAAFKLPTYDELDPTPLIAPFMGVFFGVCLGDLGYGALLTGISWAALALGRPSADARRLLRLALVLGICAMAIGILLGSVFGTRLHQWLPVPADALLFSLVDEPARLFQLSLGFGVVQLSLGLGLRLVRTLRRRRFQEALGALAWLMVLPVVGMAFAGVGPTWPLAVVAGLLVLFAVPDRRVLRRVGGGAWALYDVIGLLGAVMSYARIFGLGLSSGIIAMVVNTIAGTVAEGVGGAAGLVVAALVLVLGHAFNFAMAVLGSVVHPARLQLLEFLDTFLSGGGRAFAPFAVAGPSPAAEEESRR